MLDGDHSLPRPFVEYIDGARLYLEGESDRDLPTLQDIRLHYSRFVRYLISNTPGMCSVIVQVICSSV